MPHFTDAQYTNLLFSGALTVVAKTGAGYLKRITVGAAPTAIKVYDALSATNQIAEIGAATGTFNFEIPFTTGLTVVTTGAGARGNVIFV